MSYCSETMNIIYIKTTKFFKYDNKAYNAPRFKFLLEFNKMRKNTFVDVKITLESLTLHIFTNF